ncbi:hypothetical protein [Streptomyces sp. NPDC048309]|uniref:hypothetical protein n=1 Tax=Streptomyces sp. NPDC048309 TaxID=3154618 RepID=UPI0033E4096B
MQHLFTTKQLARARVMRNAEQFLGWHKDDLKRNDHPRDPGPFLVEVRISSDKAADVFTPLRLKELGIPRYPSDADEESTRNSCKTIGDGLFNTQHKIVAVHPVEAHLADHGEILVSAAEITMERTRGPLPWKSWYWVEGIE